MTPADLLRLAANLRPSQVDKLAHALGWPDTLNVGRRAGRVRWRNPYRNYLSSSTLDPDMQDAGALGLAIAAPNPLASGDTLWRATPLGMAVVRLRLQALLEARRLEQAP